MASIQETRAGTFQVRIKNKSLPKPLFFTFNTRAEAYSDSATAMLRQGAVPQELAVCGFGNADFAAHMQPSLTTVHVDGAEIGRLAARLVIDRCNGTPIEHPIVDVGFRIIEPSLDHA